MTFYIFLLLFYTDEYKALLGNTCPLAGNEQGTNQLRLKMGFKFPVALTRNPTVLSGMWTMLLLSRLSHLPLLQWYKQEAGHWRKHATRFPLKAFVSHCHVTLVCVRGQVNAGLLLNSELIQVWVISTYPSMSCIGFVLCNWWVKAKSVEKYKLCFQLYSHTFL